jgi:NADH-quinone oxidoreductase subunit C
MSVPIVVVKRPRGGLFAAVRSAPVWLSSILRSGSIAKPGKSSSAAPSKGERTTASAERSASTSRDDAGVESQASRAVASIDFDGLRGRLVERGAALVRASDGGFVVELSAAGASAVLRWLRDEPTLAFDVLHDLTLVDRLPDSPRFVVIYFLRSSAAAASVRVRARIESDPPEIDSVVKIWPSADWLEREAHDLFGVRFRGHPGLHPLLLPADFEGAPLRRDFVAEVEPAEARPL